MSEDVTETPTAINDDALAQEIAAALTEPNVGLIRKISAVIGPAHTQALLREALALEAKQSKG